MKKYLNLYILIFFSVSLSLSAFDIKYDKDEILRAMKDELNRSMNELKLETLDKPYYIAYTLKLRSTSSIKSILGSVVDSGSFNFASMNVEVRVGDYKLDNSNFFDVGLGFFGSADDEEVFKNRRLPYELSYNVIRRELWLATDAAYKQNSEIYSKKLSVMQNRIRKDTIPDFTRIEPAKNYIFNDFPKFDMIKNAELLNKLSAILKAFPEINSSSVSMEYLPEVTFYVNSEGMEYVNSEYYTGLETAVFTQADDGMPVADFYTCFSKSPDNLPALDSLKKSIELMSKNLVSVKSSKTLEEPYSGPVLFSGQAAVEVISQVFAPQLVAQRVPMSEGGIQTDARYSAFQNKIGGRVLPEFLSLKAVPNLKKYNNTDLLGNFDIDDDGLKPQEVDLVFNGYLKNLLSDRTPTRRVKQSNGHKRGGAAMYSNLILSSNAEKSLSDKDLTDKMIKLCKDRELPYGIIITKIINQNLMFTTLWRTSGGLFQIPRGEGKLSVSEAYKVFPNGRKELIRGGEINNLSVQSFKDIIFTGKNNYAGNLLAPSVVSSFISGGDQYVGASIITPDLLFEDAEIKSIEDSFPKPPILKNPVYSGK